MDISLELTDPPYHFVATGLAGVEVRIDASPTIGGTGDGVRPMELLLMGIAGCSAIDVVHILRKQRLEVPSLSVRVHGEREPDAVPAVFTEIRLDFTFGAELPEAKVRRAIELSLEKYCSAAAMLRKTARIDYTLTME